MDWLARLRRALAPSEPAHAWPGQDLVARPLADWPRLQSWALIGRAIDPDLAGSALALLALAGVEPVKGGLGALGAGFARTASGAELRLGQEVSEVAIARGRVSGLLLADGLTPAGRRLDLRVWSLVLKYGSNRGSRCKTLR